LRTDEVQLPPVAFGTPVEKHREILNMFAKNRIAKGVIFRFENVYVGITYLFVCVLASWKLKVKVKVKVKQFCNRRGQTLRAAGG
jgi:hypothetical protein